MNNIKSKLGTFSTKRWQQIALAVAVLTMGLAPFFNVGTASALSDCGAGYVCLYKNYDFFGTATRYYSPSSGCQNVANGDTATSVINKMSSRGVTYFDYANCAGPFYFYDGPGGYRRNLTNDCWSIGCAYGNPNDKISSFWVN